MLLLCALIVGSSNVWADTYEQLTSIASIDESAEYVLGIDGTGFHYDGTSSWGKTALPSAQTPLKYTLKKANDNNSFTAETTISATKYYLQVPTSNTFSMTTSAGTNTNLIIGTTQVSGTNYAVANKTTTARHLRINGTSGLRSYAGTTGTMAFFYKVIKATDPEATLSTSSLVFGRVKAGTTKVLTFTVTPANLESALSITCNNSKYEVTPTSIASDVETATTITVTAKPTSMSDDMDGTITISGGGLDEDKTVSLSCNVTDPNETVYVFSEIDGFASWSTSYGTHDVTYPEATVTFTAADKQTSNITDIPVQKKGDVILALSNKGEIISSVCFTCRQWTTKTQTLQIYASSDGGSTWSDQIGDDESDFEITCSLPANTNAVKLTTTEDNQVGIESVSFVVDAEHYNVKISSAGWATISCSKEIEIPAGVTAYYAEEKDASTVTLKEITGGYIPANTGVVVAGTEGTYTANVTETGATLSGTNLLKPWTTAGEPTDGTYYTLAVDGSNNPVFKLSTGGTLAAGKAYLVLPAGGARELSVSFGGETTGIDEVRGQKEDVRGEYFNLAGQRVAQPTRGLYIVNGRKVVIK